VSASGRPGFRAAKQYSLTMPPALDPTTLRALERLLSERLAVLEAYGPGCQTCRDAEARAFLARLRALIGGNAGGAR